MVQENIEKYTGLVEHLLSLNDDVIDPMQINMGISRAIAEGYPLEGMQITKDLKIVCSLSDKEECMKGVAGVLKVASDFLSAVLEEESVESKFFAPMRRYIDEKDIGEISPFLSDLLLVEAPSSTLDEKTDSEKIALIYGACITPYLKKSKRNYGKHLKSLFSSFADIEVGETVVLTPKIGEGLTVKMGDAFDKFLDLFFSLEGKELDIKTEGETIRPILDGFRPAPQELGIQDTILFGSLSSMITTGLVSVDSLLGGGIPRGESVVLRSPPGWENEVLTRRFIRSTLVSGGSVVLVLSSMSVEDFTAQMDRMGLDITRHLEKGSLQIIDWFSHNFKRIVGIEVKDNIITCSHDLTNVNMALEECLNRMSHAPVKAGIVEITSPALMRFGFDTTYEFVQAVNSRFKTAGVGGLVVLIKGMHSMEHLHSLSGIFSNAVDIERRVGLEGGDLLISASSVMAVRRNYITASWTSRGLVMEGDNVEVVPFTYEKDVVGLDIGGRDMIGGGLPEGRSVMVLAPECPEKEFLISSFTRRAKERDDKLVVILGSMEPGDYSLPEGFDPSNVVFVDWFSHKNEKIIGVEKIDNILRVSQDISHLAIAIKQALETTGSGAFVVMDVLTPLLRYYELPVVFSFALSISAILRKHGATALVPFDGEVFDPEFSNAFMYALDGTVHIREGRELGGVKLIWIPGIRNGYTTGRTAVCSIQGNRINLESIDKYMEAGKKGALAGKDQTAMLDALRRENEKLKRELLSIENAEPEQPVAVVKEDTAVLVDEIKSLRRSINKDSENIGRVLAIIDEMFEKLPKDVLDRFMESKDFAIYEKVVDRYALGGSDEENNG